LLSGGLDGSEKWSRLVRSRQGKVVSSKDATVRVMAWARGPQWGKMSVGWVTRMRWELYEEAQYLTIRVRGRRRGLIFN
jgi:hypothetical protein